MVDYPNTRRSDSVEVLHGRTIADPYRWLEDPDSAETRDWVSRQNAFSNERLSALPGRKWFTETLTSIVRRPRAGVPRKSGGRYFVSRNDGTQDQDQIFVADTLEELRAGGRLVLDPNTLSADGTTSIRGFDCSGDGRYLSYQVSEGGSDWVDITVLDPATGDPIDEPPIQTKFGSANWLPDNESFVYQAVPHDGRADGSQAAQVKTGMLKLHRIGTPESDDRVIIDVRDEYQQGFVEPVVTADDRYLTCSLFEGTESSNRLWIHRLEDDQGRSVPSEPIKLIDTAYAQFDVVRSNGSKIILYTDHEANNGRVVEVDLDDFERTGELRLHELIAESENAVLGIDAAGDELIIVRMIDATPKITRYALDGTKLGDVDVPGGSVTALWSKPEEPEWFIGMSTITSPSLAYRVEAGSGVVEPLPDLAPAMPPAFGSRFTPPTYHQHRRRARSADGTEVPYFLITPDGTSEIAGPRPTLLYGYGGFNIPVLADYRPMWSAWLAAGGVIAIANLRGGSEYGTSWYDGGRLANKQNVFDDFVAVGEDLISSGVTTHDQLAIHGASNGGLLVGAVMTQRPDLAAVALPKVGVLDLLRFHKFTAGAAWTSDYGDPDNAEDFAIALAYSPLHNVHEVAYPATLIMTGDHDDRVVPLHSHKFAATLQHAQRGDAPILTRIETQTGHGMGKPLAMVAAENADMLAFAAEHTGLKVSDEVCADGILAP